MFPNTHTQAKIQVDKFLEFLNDCQDSGDYKYHNKIKIVMDYTHTPPRPADAWLVDKEVVFAKFWNSCGHEKDYVNELQN